MFVAHAPAGYVLTSVLLKHYAPSLDSHRIVNRLFWFGIVMSLLPDSDLFYFYLIDQCQHLHHSYWIHIPAYWLLICAGCAVISRILNKKLLLLATIILGANIFLHLILDTVVGYICWFYPFSSRAIAIFTVPARYSWWGFNFLLHWTFLFEILIILLAILYWQVSQPLTIKETRATRISV